MIRFFFANDLSAYKLLGCSMFKDRKLQFRDRLKWDVTVDSAGQERDQYDELNPLYIVWENENGLHGGSMRFLPTLERCMFNDHFTYITEGRKVSSPTIWECTRFCLAPGSDSHVAAALMLAGGELMQSLGIEQFIGVFDCRMRQVYRRIGAPPVIIGSAGLGRDKISAGLWSFSERTKEAVATSAGISPSDIARWFDGSSVLRSLRTNIAA